MIISEKLMFRKITGKQKKFILFILSFFLTTSGWLAAEPVPEPALTATLNGFVRDAGNEETIIGATVFIAELKIGAYTNKSGYYSLSGIPEGEFTVV
ncbi:MAG: TonB-dependent receptor, partial [Bacteroidota bacterium]|nr:TonB-dependent receptor [Bacteroidota bacterium]